MKTSSLTEVRCKVAVFVLILYFNFYAIMGTFTSRHYFILPLLFLLTIPSKIRLNKENNILIGWIVFMAFMVLHNVAIKAGDYATTIRIVFSFAICFNLSQAKGWREFFVKMLILIGYLNVLATFFFFMFPSAYNVMVRLYGMIPTGTMQGTMGYRAALANHYSQNAIFISVVTLATAVVLFYDNWEKRPTSHMIFRFILITSFAALIMTNKRAHIIFVVLIIFYLYLKKNQKLTKRKLVAFIGIPIGLTMFLIWGYFYFPPIYSLLNRFLDIGSDSSVSERLLMIQLAISLFVARPIFGIGMLGFRVYYNQRLFSLFRASKAYAYLNAHNVYLQVLCELGIVGEIIYLFSILGAFRLCISKNRANESSQQHSNYLIVSYAIQLFYLLYSFTGNCLYDIVYVLYAQSIALTLDVRER